MCRKIFEFTTEFTTNDGKTKQNYAKLCQNTEKIFCHRNVKKQRKIAEN